LTTGAGPTLWTPNPISTNGTPAAFTALGLSPDGSTLYAAGNNGYIYGFYTSGSVASQVPGSPVGPSSYANGPIKWHDIAVDQAGNVYATAFSDTLQGVAKFSPGLSLLNQYFIVSPHGGTSGLAGMIVDPNDYLWVSDFSTTGSTQPGVYEYKIAGLTKGAPITSFSSALFYNPLGLAVGPGDGDIYVANFHSTSHPTYNGTYGVLQIDPSAAVPVMPFISDAGDNPKYLSFVQNCTSAAASGYIEVCKMSSTTNPIPDTGTYPFTVTGSAFNSSTSQLIVPVGECSGPISVAAGTATIKELPTPGVGVNEITAVGYSPPPFSQEGTLPLESSDTQTGTAMVIVLPSATGDTSTESLVTYWNYEAPNGQLKICKVSGNASVPVGTPFTFTTVNIMNAGSGYTSVPTVTITGCATPPIATATVSGGSVTGIDLTSPGSGCTPPLMVTIGPPPNLPAGNIPATAAAAILSVEAGPQTEGGYCQVVPGTFEVGTSGTVTETVPLNPALAPISSPAVTITVNGIPTTSTSCAASPNPSATSFPCSVAALIGPGINEVSFTNSMQSSGLQPGTGGDPFSNLDIVNYSLVSQVPATGTQSYMKYRADLLNTGKTTMGPIVATLTSLDPSGVRVVGQGALNFASAPPSSQVASSNTFTVLTNPAVPLDFSKLSWTYQSRRSIRPVHLKPVADTPLR
jgi:hypothetical protein